jgi:Transposase zinc-binding domain/Putative transposase
VGRSALEVADIFRTHGASWRRAQHGHLSLGQLKVMSAIVQCRSAALGGHVLRCEGCASEQISYNSCRNRHCPKCQSRAAQRWLDARQADLLPVDYYHVVFTLPAPIADIAYQNKAVVYGLLFDIAAEVLLTIAADRRHLGARIGATLVLHTWGSALTHHPHVHGIVPGGGLSPDGQSWIACRPGFFLSVRVLSRLFRRRFLEELLRAHQAGKLQFFGEHAGLLDAKAFKAWLAPLRKCEWGGLRQAPLRRAQGGAGLPVALHAPRGHLQQPAHRAGRARRHLRLEGLSGQGPNTPQGDDARRR